LLDCSPAQSAANEPCALMLRVVVERATNKHAKRAKEWVIECLLTLMSVSAEIQR